MALKGPRTGSYTNAVTSRYNFNRLPTADFVLAQTPTPPDEYFKDTTLLLSTSSTNGAQNNTFLDSSTNNFTITRNGNATQGTYSPYSHTGWSNYFDGTGDYLSIPASETFMNIGTNNLTIEGWVYFNSVGAGTFFGAADSGGNSSSGVIIYLSASGTLRVYGPSVSGTITTSVATGTWYHIAVTRQTNTWTLWLNGTSQGTFTDSGSVNPGASKPLAIGRLGAYDGFYLTGYVSNIRFINGTALYTSAFTPSTSPLTAIANTSLLTCQSNRFIDNSTNNFTVTRNGDVSIQPFEPFAPGVEYSASTVGGSVYLDGTGDFLTVPDNSSYGYGTGDFTIEFWMYPNSVGLQTVVSNLTSASSTNPHLYISSSIRYYTANADRITGASLVTGQWYHIALCRNSGSTRLFVNGTQSGSTYSDTNNYGSSAPLGIGTYWNGASPVNENTFNGYISNLRILKGTGLYTGNFTPPSLPATTAGSSTPYTNTSNVNTTFSAANTSLLCNFTNAGIFDATAKNILETVGNAQASQTQTKFGVSSMYFDGTDDRLFAPSSAINTLNGDFTFEAWIYRAATGADHSIIDIGDYAGSTGIVFYVSSTATLAIYSGSGLMSGGTIPTNTWTHVALVRSGTSSGNLKLYVNGSSVGTPATSTSTFTGALYVGTGLYNGGLYNNWNGYLDDVRITRYARYTANFTPPTKTFSTQ